MFLWKTVCIIMTSLECYKADNSAVDCDFSRDTCRWRSVAELVKATEGKQICGLGGNITSCLPTASFALRNTWSRKKVGDIYAEFTSGLGDPENYIFGYVYRMFRFPMGITFTSFILSESLPISFRPRSLRYSYYLYRYSFMTVSYLTDVSVYNSKIIAAHNTSFIKNDNFTEGCVDLPFDPDAKVVFRAIIKGNVTGIQAVLLSDVTVENNHCKDVAIYELTQSMKRRCLFPLDDCPFANASALSPDAGQKSFLNISLCPFCGKMDFNIYTRSPADCYCTGKEDKCFYCKCFTASTSVIVQNISCDVFRIEGPPQRNLITVQFLNATIPEISLDNVRLDFNDKEATSIVYSNERPYQYIRVDKGTLKFFIPRPGFHIYGSMRNVKFHFSATQDIIYMAENNFEDVTEINVVEYHPTLTSTNFSLCNISDHTSISINSKIVDLSRNAIREYFVSINTEVLYIQHNFLDKMIKNNTEKIINFSLSILDISHNKITKLQRADFTHFAFLVSVNLSGNLIQSIDDDAFSDLFKLVLIDLSGNKISTISREHFRGLRQLQFMYLQNNNIFHVPSDIFYGLLSMKYLQVQSFSICCAKPQSMYNVRCVAPATEISSCEHLIAVPVLNVAIWYMALLALFGNISVMIYTFAYFKNKVSASYFILTLNLSFADLLMGIYLFIIAIVNLHYTGHYGLVDYAWRHSWLCTLAGILATVSSETSAFIVFLITVDRLLAIKCYISDKRITKTGITCVIVWLISFFLALFPLTVFKNFYSQSGVCITLPFSVNRKSGWRYSMAIFVGINALLFIGILIGQIAIFVEALKVGKDVRSAKIRAREISLAKTLIAIVVTDILCWIPIGFIGLVTFFGTNVSSEVYAWIVVLILPVNSALNPVLYTLSAVIRQKSDNHINRLTQELLILRNQLDSLRSLTSSQTKQD